MFKIWILIKELFYISSIDRYLNLRILRRNIYLKDKNLITVIIKV